MDLSVGYEERKRNGEGRNAAVLWVAGVGAALLAAAAGLFVAVRWSEIPPEGKLAIILGVTALFLVIGESVKRTLPATGSVLFHLGAFLLPVDLAAVDQKLGMSWQQLLLAEGVLGVVAFGGLGRLGRSKVLSDAAAVSVVVAAIGSGAVTGFPAPLVLALVALGVSATRPRSMAALGWSIVAGFLPVIVLPLSTVVPDALSAFGMSDVTHPFFAIATGAITAFVLGRAATLDRDLTLAFFAIGTFCTSVATSWISADVPQTANAIALTGAFLAIEAVALLSLRDPFWAKPVNWLANAADVFTVRTVLLAGAVVLIGASALSRHVPDRTMAAAFAIAAVGWIASTLRRHLQADATLMRLSAIAASVCALGAVRSATTSQVVIGVVVIASAALLLMLRSAATDATATALVVYLPILVSGDAVVTLVGAFAGAAILIGSAIVSARDGRVAACRALIGSAIVTIAFGCIRGSDLFDAQLAGLLFAGSCLAIAALFDARNSDVAFGARVASLGALVSLRTEPGEQLLVLVPLLVAIAVEAVRLGQARIAYIGVVPLQLSVISLCAAAGLDVPSTGLVLCTAAIVWAGLGEAIGGRWSLPFASAAASGAAAGLVFAAGDPAMFGAAMIVVGASVLGIGLLRGSATIAHVGGVALTVGAWVELAAGGVTALEAYVAPVCAYLLFAGAHERRIREVSSWMTYAPAVVLLAGAALLERMVGGAGWHAVVAGTVGVAAVVAGASRRLSGPLVTGTVVLAVVTVFESLAVAATIPTWAWLATAGSALVATAVILERNGTSPLDAGRRVVDVLATSFE